MKLIKPHRLQTGMTIGLVAPASGVQDTTAIDNGIAGLQRLGYNVVEGKHIRKKRGYLSATDKERAADLNAMFGNRRIDTVMCVRGGYGTPRLLPLLDYDRIRKNPKIFIGFSDVTMLHLAILRQCRHVTFNGPMLTFTFADDHPHEFTVAGFHRTLTEPKPAGSIWQGHPDRNFRVVRPGRASGRLTGGNLSLAAASLGTRDEIDTRGRIVFLEDVDEKPYRIDRMLTQLLNAGKLRDAAAVVFGRNVPDEESALLEEQRAPLKRTAAPPPKSVSRTFEPIMDDVIAELLRPLGVPVLIGLPFGHIKDYATLPLGICATVDSRTGDLVLEESAVV